MKLYVSSFNGVLDDFKDQAHCVDPIAADKMVLWQDCVGSWGKLAEFSKKFFPKPLYVMQHGRRSSRDYGAPLNRPFRADMFLAWGKWDYENVRALGMRSEIVGCPLNTWIKPPVPHKEKCVLFVPVNTGKEEPDNISVYYELLKLKLNKAQEGLRRNYEALRSNWKDVTKNKLADDFTILTKTLSWHEQKLYTEGVLKGFQDSRKNNELLFNLLRNVDLVVGVDEGTTELFAIAHGIPVIIVDGFEYRWAEGNCRAPVIKTPGFRHVKLEELQDAVNETLANPKALEEERRYTAELELSLDSIKDPIGRLNEVLKKDL
jgi:hypothetical protein